MHWIRGGEASHYTEDGVINRRAELKDKLGAVEIDGVESHLEWLAMRSPNSTVAYALFEEKETGRKWAAVVLTTTHRKKTMDYALIPESLNPDQCGCGKRILEMLTPIEPGADPGAEEWRRRCWEEVERKEKPSLFKSLPEGTKVRWTVGSDEWPLLPKGRKVVLVKVKKENYRWYWKDVSNGVLYDKDAIPVDDYEVIEE